MLTPEPIALTVFGLPIYWYGVMVGGGMLLGLLVTLRRALQSAVHRRGPTGEFLLLAIPLGLVPASGLWI